MLGMAAITKLYFVGKKVLKRRVTLKMRDSLNSLFRSLLKSSCSCGRNIFDLQMML